MRTENVRATHARGPLRRALAERTVCPSTPPAFGAAGVVTAGGVVVTTGCAPAGGCCTAGGCCAGGCSTGGCTTGGCCSLTKRHVTTSPGATLIVAVAVVIEPLLSASSQRTSVSFQP